MQYADVEADYIRQEASQQFHAHQRDTDPQDIAKLTEEGENRLAIGLHYGIAYPRLHHADQFAKVPYVQAPKLDTADEPEAVASGIKDKDVAARLAAAARRRRERLAQQRQQQEG
ncbi:hypothetical protein CHLNCDRAFT_138167 [Chlorella variabilis]|uniref:Complex 1 LYR protein domain-containing protein n=1 Tax=Chlorella variabilis TaxID=554065 RepID=E1Z3Q1_CHLVA|nr:hypothetical protein CHLNCDRAFT_138167 [Chlorella variabilis]EFN59519.1 hypothetical protein CHLNCDRAFT_138167 [Chlorella variabilis]|eukprot:XP_005851621.1 hypothetical protein CHLNCDRAFT_138167 [Chlorella variabilis]